MTNIPNASVPATPADQNAPRWRLGDLSGRASPCPVVSFEYLRGMHQCCVVGCKGEIETDWRAVITMPDDELRAAIVQNARDCYVGIYKKWSGIHPRSLARDDDGLSSLQSWADSGLGIIQELLTLAEGFQVKPEHDMSWLAQVPGASNPAVRIALREVAVGSAT